MPGRSEARSGPRRAMSEESCTESDDDVVCAPQNAARGRRGTPHVLDLGKSTGNTS